MSAYITVDTASRKAKATIDDHTAGVCLLLGDIVYPARPRELELVEVGFLPVITTNLQHNFRRVRQQLIQAALAS